MPDNPHDTLAMLMVDRVFLAYTSISYFKMIKQLKHILQLKYILQWSSTFVVSVYAQKFIYIITWKVYASLKVKNTSYDSKLHTMLLK